MYVCICNAVTDGEIREAYAEGACTFAAQQEQLGVSTCCGCCKPAVREIISTCQAEAGARSATTPLLALPQTAVPSMG